MGDMSDGLAENDGYEIRLKTTSDTNSVYSKEITIIDSPILSINGDSSKVEGPDRQTIGKAAVTWEQQAGATSYTIRWRKLVVQHH